MIICFNSKGIIFGRGRRCKAGWTALLLVWLAVLLPGPVSAQMIRIDAGVRVAGLWVFPLATQPNTYRYLPERAFISKTDRNQPAFSMLRYVALDKDGDTPINQADGGALLTFLTEYGTEAERVAEALKELRKLPGQEKAKITGPVIFKEGSFALISSLVGSRDTSETQVLNVSRVPVLEGSKMAYSFNMEPRESKILMESFKMTTSDVSLSYELTFGGVVQTFNGTIEVDWEQVYEYTSRKEETNAFFYKEESLKTVESLFSSQAVTMTIMGEEKASEKMLAVAYEKVMNLVFEPIDIEEYRDKNSTMDDLDRAWKGFQDGAASVATFGLSSMGSKVGYRMKNIKRSGKTRIEIDKSSIVERHHYLTFNLGDLYEQYGKDKQIFNTVNILDPDFMQRQVFVGIDGSLKAAFQQQVNDITVEIKKVHGDGTTTLDALRIDEKSFAEIRRVGYLNRGDFGLDFAEAKMEEWMHYEYRTIWDFKGGGRYEAPWTRTRGSINLFVPYRAQDIIFEGRLQSLWDAGTIAVVVDIHRDFFGTVQPLKSVRIRPGDDLTTLTREYVAPINQKGYRYRIRYIGADDDVRTQDWQEDDDGIIVIKSSR